MKRYSEKVNLPWVGDIYLAKSDSASSEYVTEMQDALKKLYDYEEAEEQGLLLRMPCKIGDTVYVICDCNHVIKQLDGTLCDLDGGPGTATGYYCPYEDCCPHNCGDFTFCEDYAGKEAVSEDTISCINISECGISIIVENTSVFGELDCGYIFFSKEAAEQALKNGGNQ